jgi:glycine cleavage system aminomethyltransferase T
MGEIWVEGEDAIKFVNRLTTNDVTKLVDGQAHYSALTNENGGVVDDLLVYRFDQDKLLCSSSTLRRPTKIGIGSLRTNPDENITLTNAAPIIARLPFRSKARNRDSCSS